ncbi:MAG TPA: hypothetical protein VIM74_05355 [Casimicrobiaceae bacterium]|jgi:hypothetical protein
MPGTGVFQLPPVKSEPVTLGADYTFVMPIEELYVGGAGTVIAKLSSDATFRTYLGVAAGTVLRGAFTNVKSTANGTTASGIIGRSRSTELPNGL